MAPEPLDFADPPTTLALSTGRSSFGTVGIRHKHITHM